MPSKRRIGVQYIAGFRCGRSGSWRSGANTRKGAKERTGAVTGNLMDTKEREAANRTGKNEIEHGGEEDLLHNCG